jgi:hypothetical protein
LALVAQLKQQLVQLIPVAQQFSLLQIIQTKPQQ